MTKIVFIGAGSTVFMKNILTDVLLEPELQSSHIVLHDIDDRRLQTSQLVAEKVSSTIGTPAIIETKADRKDCLLYTSPSPRDRTRSRMPSSA